MGRRNGRRSADRVAAVHTRIEHWRRTRRRHGRMPEELWEAATSLARVDGAYAVARELGLNYATLKGRVERAVEVKRRSARASGFVELDGAQLLGGVQAPASVVELADTDGARLTVRLGGGEGLDVEALAEAFWRRSQ